jgi:uncharacterized membrane protein YphA (DoxX/SURF4 family)
MIPFLGGFWRDWLVVSGRLDPAPSGSNPSGQTQRLPLLAFGSAPYTAVIRAIQMATTRWLPVALRAVAALIGAFMGIHRLRTSPDQAARLADLGVPWPGALVIVVGLVEIITAPLLALGVAARLAGLALAFFTGIAATASGITTPLAITALVSGLAITVLGSGAFSLWTPEEALLTRRAGEKRQD